MSLKRLREDEAAIGELQQKVAKVQSDIRKFTLPTMNIMGRRVPYRTVSSRAPGFAFQQPSAPVVNVNAAPSSVPMDISAQGELVGSGPGMSYSIRPPPPLLSPTPSVTYKRRAPFFQRYAKKKSKESLKRASMSEKKGGTRPAKKTLQKAGRQADYIIALRHFMKLKKYQLENIVHKKTKGQIAICLAKLSAYGE